MRFILASSSPRRRELLSKAGYVFDVIPSAAEESSSKKLPSARVKEIALQKAFEVASRYPGDYVVGADTLVFCKGRIIGKPKDKKDALKILNFLNGAKQSVYTGVAVVNKNKKKLLLAYDVSECYARKLSAAELQKMSSKHLDKAGAYAMQDKEDILIRRVKGSVSNVVGMPLELFSRLYKEFTKR